MLVILWGWFSLIVLMSGVWAIFRITGNPSIVDVAWSIGHWLVGTLFLFSHGIHPRSFILWLILTLWAGRLAGYLYWTRIRIGLVDKRYTQLSAQWRIAPSIGFFFNFQMQGFLILLLTISLYLNGQVEYQSLGWLDGIGLFTIIFSIIFASKADGQLHRFVKEQPGKVCNVGLWQYSRHPNYFFEWLVWVGFALTALSTTHGWLALISPLILYVIMTRITGPMTESGSVSSKGKAYQDYQAKTAYFLPWPIRKKNGRP
jgi:steroid 5-alpha reductase family enzyme